MWFLFACTAPETQKAPVEPGKGEERSVFQSFHEEVTALKLQNVVVVQVDTLRADRLPFYGGPHDTLPDSAAQPGWAVWGDAISSSSWTFPSVASLLTSVDVHQHGLMDVSQTMPGIVELPMWQRNLGGAQIHTGYFNGNSGILLTNMYEGWERAEMGEEYPDNAVSGVAAALLWLDQIPREEPFFVLLQPMDSHAPWHPFPEYLGQWSDPDSLPFSVEDSETDQKILLQTAADGADMEEEVALRENMLALYDEEILGMDRAILNLLQGLEARGLSQNTLVVFTADHGEGFFEKRSTFGHGGSVRQELVQVPLAFYHPSFTTKMIESCPVGNMDLLPMVGAWVGWPELVPPPEDCRTEVPVSFYRRESEQHTLLEKVGLVARDIRVEVDCQTGEILAYDRVDDPAALSSVAPAALEGGPELLEKLRAHVAEVQARRPEIACVPF